MHLRSTLFFAAALGAAHLRLAAANSKEQACLSDSSDDVLHGHTSLLQTSVQLKTEPPEDVVSKPKDIVSEPKDIVSKPRRNPQGLAGWRMKGHSLASVSTLASAHGSREEAQSHVSFFMLNALLVVGLVCLFVYLRRGGAGEAAAPSEVEERHDVGFEEDVYMMAVALISRDWHIISKTTTKNRYLPAIRIFYATALLFTTLAMQLALVVCTKKYVTPQYVANIRDSYDQYEIHMYGGEANTRTLYTGKHRGQPGFFNESLFETLDDDLKGDVCQIPFSQMKFLVFVLVIWSITCVAQINQCVLYMWNLLVMLPNVSSMADGVTAGPAGTPRRKWTIEGLTVQVKLMMLFVVFLPWLGSTCYLCWLGCRWLAATADFGDFVTNAMALEFILQFKTIFYMAVASERSKRDLQCTKHKPPSRKEEAGYQAYFSPLLWGLVVVVWVYAYIFHLQHVLPEYQWDVHAPCTPYLAGVLRPDAD